MERERERERERGALRGVLHLHRGLFGCFRSDPLLHRMPAARCIRALSQSHSQWAAARPAIGLDENRFFRCFVECRHRRRRRRFVYLSTTPTR